jgi:hypothetical protein
MRILSLKSLNNPNKNGNKLSTLKISSQVKKEEALIMHSG